MARILSSELSATQIALGGPYRVEVNFVVRFSPMEKLLSNYGLRFVARISFYDVDTPSDSIDNDDFLDIRRRVFISSAQIAGTPNNNRLALSFSDQFSPEELRGPDDDGSLYFERLRARICVVPTPGNATEVVRSCSMTNFVLVDTQGPIINPPS
ncbi:MAG: hypothetical protein MRZ79_04115 [Bacteroidia bacterium]|nr:hypothetical protein [Bacteroidia bacterium]